MANYSFLSCFGIGFLFCSYSIPCLTTFILKMVEDEKSYLCIWNQVLFHWDFFLNTLLFKFMLIPSSDMIHVEVFVCSNLSFADYRTVYSLFLYNRLLFSKLLNFVWNTLVFLDIFHELYCRQANILHNLWFSLDGTSFYE